MKITTTTIRLFKKKDIKDLKLKHLIENISFRTNGDICLLLYYGFLIDDFFIRIDLNFLKKVLELEIIKK